ncbi:hypothetical protein Tco_0303539 [Tanacetum coccineum]
MLLYYIVYPMALTVFLQQAKLALNLLSSSQTEGEHIKKDKGKKALSSKEAVKESTKSDSDDDETHLSGSMIESSRKKKERSKKEELIDLLGSEVVKKYYNDKLQYDRDCDKMLNRRAVSRITNCDVLTRKGPITLKVYREDGTREIILKFKASDLHLSEWREVMKACPNKIGKGWETIYKQIDTRIDYIHTTEAELANKRLKSSVQYEDHLPSTVLNEPVLASALQVLRRLGSIFTSVYAAKLKRVVSLLEDLQGGKKDCFMSKGIKQSP